MSAFRMMMNEEAQRMFMSMIKGSPLPSTTGKHRVSEILAAKNNSVNLTALFVLTTVVIDALVMRENIDENPDGKRQQLLGMGPYFAVLSPVSFNLSC